MNAITGGRQKHYIYIHIYIVHAVALTHEAASRVRLARSFSDHSKSLFGSEWDLWLTAAAEFLAESSFYFYIKYRYCCTYDSIIMNHQSFTVRRNWNHDIGVIVIENQSSQCETGRDGEKLERHIMFRSITSAKVLGNELET